MTIYLEFQKIVGQIADNYCIPTITDVYFPPFFKEGQPKEYEFIAIKLESGVCGISFVLLTNEEIENYQTVARSNFLGVDPVILAGDFGSQDPVKNMIGLAALNETAGYNRGCFHPIVHPWVSCFFHILLSLRVIFSSHSSSH